VTRSHPPYRPFVRGPTPAPAQPPRQSPLVSRISVRELTTRKLKSTSTARCLYASTIPSATPYRTRWKRLSPAGNIPCQFRSATTPVTIRSSTPPSPYPNCAPLASYWINPVSLLHAGVWTFFVSFVLFVVQGGNGAEKQVWGPCIYSSMLGISCPSCHTYRISWSFISILTRVPFLSSGSLLGSSKIGSAKEPNLSWSGFKMICVRL